MEAVGDETSDASIAFIQKQHKGGKPWFVWLNGVNMHFRTHVQAGHHGISPQDEYSDGIKEVNNDEAGYPVHSRHGDSCGDFNGVVGG